MSSAAKKNKRRNFNNHYRHQKAEIIFPHFHTNILTALSGSITPTPYFQHNKTRSTDDYSTNIIGTFFCMNPTCPRKGWGSKKVAILIRRYGKGNGIGCNAVVFNQRCKSCDQLGSLTIDKRSYVERVMYRLKKWAGVQVAEPVYNAGTGPEHERDLCEGCKRGLCKGGQ